MASIAPANLTIFPIAAPDGAPPRGADIFSVASCRRVDAVLRQAPTDREDDSFLSDDSRSELLTEVLQVANALSCCRTRSGLCIETLPSNNNPSPTVVAAHCSVRSRLSGAFDALERPSGDQPLFGQALPELLKSSDTISAASLTTCRPYNPDLVNVVKEGHNAVDLVPLLPTDARRLILDPHRILRDDADLADELLTTPLYTDPALRRYDVLLELALTLK
jgi:hypothetical protein